MIGRLLAWAKRSHPSAMTEEQIVKGGWGRPPVLAGTVVDGQAALGFVAVFACIRILAESVGSLPCHLYRRRGDGGKERASGHWLYRLIHRAPHPDMTATRLFQVLQGHLVSWGNAYAFIETTGNKRAGSLWPMAPDRTFPEFKAGKLQYRYTPRTGKPKDFAKEEILHIPGLGFDGVQGYSPIHMAREAIGLGKATEEFGARFFGSGTNPGTVFRHPTRLQKETFDRLKKEIASHAGLSKAFDGMILEDGMELVKIGIPPEDAQFLETRRFQVNEVARLFRVPPHMLADLERATFSNIEHQSLEFVQHTLRPWLVLWEQELARQLLPPQDQDEYFVEFLVDGLLRGDIKSRYEAYAVARQNGWMSANDVRRLENMDPIEDGDIYLVPMNMIPADMAGQTQDGPGPAQEPAARSERRSTDGRAHLVGAQIPVFRHAVDRIVRREVSAIRKAVEKHFAQRGYQDFRTWLEEFYRDIPRQITAEFSPLFLAYSELVQAEAAQEVKGERGMSEAMRRDVDAYTETFATRYTAASLGQIRSIAESAPTDEVEEQIGQRLERWEDSRADTVAYNEAHRLCNAVARWTFIASGVRKLKWVTVGDDCPFCASMNGRTVGVDENFLSAGEGLEVPGRSGPLIVRGNHTHPPIHRGCDCMIVAG